MKESLKLVLSVTLVLVVLSFVSVFAGKEKSGIIFSHKLHVVQNEMECTTCHSAAEKSVKGTDNLMPSMEVCGSCHDIESESSCGMCHTDVNNPQYAPRVENYFPNFSHEMHLSAGLNCESCHAVMENKEMVEPYVLPTIEACQQCHTQKKVMPQSHGPNYLHTHGDDARSSSVAMVVNASQTCKTCHAVQFCQTCHEGDNLDRISHPLNYTYTHSLDAMGKEKDCMVCHTERSFCIECHQQNFVLPYNHTAGWANRIPGDGGRHRIEAERDLESCMSCHEQDAQQVCQKCHSK
jgi:hypothetical protein